MTQPNLRIGPPFIGGQALIGDSQAGAGSVLRHLQQQARGVGEWIDANQTAGADALACGHDHRGNVWGRPVGSGFALQFQDMSAGGAEFLASSLLLVPDCSPLGASEIHDPAANGGWQGPAVGLYANLAAPGPLTCFLELAPFSDPLRTTTETLAFNHPGGGLAWGFGAARLTLPPGLLLVRLRAPKGAAVSIEAFSFMVGH